jgi:hypothetical protein
VRYGWGAVFFCETAQRTRKAPACRPAGLQADATAKSTVERRGGTYSRGGCNPLSTQVSGKHSRPVHLHTRLLNGAIGWTNGYTRYTACLTACLAIAYQLHKLHVVARGIIMRAELKWSRLSEQATAFLLNDNYTLRGCLTTVYQLRKLLKFQ